MRIFVLLCAITAFIKPCLALEPADAARIIYYFTCYDFDATVWGQGRGYLAPKCSGTQLANKKCTFDEFVNYLFTGNPSNGNSYYDTSSDFSLFTGDVAAMATALKAAGPLRDLKMERLLENRQTAIGLFDDLAKIMGLDQERAKIRGIGGTRHLSNIKLALGGFRLHMSAHLEGSLTERLQRWNEKVIWKIVERESTYAEYKWKRVDWEATVMANPDLSSPNSVTYRNIVKALVGFDDLEGTIHDKSMAYKAANSFNSCFAPMS